MFTALRVAQGLAVRRFLVAQRLSSTNFVRRHIAVSEADTKVMLETINKELKSLDELASAIVPKSIAFKDSKDGLLKIPADGLPEHEFLAEMKALASKNKNTMKSMIGMGYEPAIAGFLSSCAVVTTILLLPL